MKLVELIPMMLAAAWLLPLASFMLIVLFGPKMGKGGKLAAYVATSAIVAGAVISWTALAIWVANSEPPPEHSAEHHAGGHDVVATLGDAEHDKSLEHSSAHIFYIPKVVTGDWYSLATFGSLKLTIGYYIDTLTLIMFAMVTLIASCIHFYSIGYMHDELHEVTDHEVTLPDGHHLHRPGRFHRFFQYLSLFCFSMLGLVISGNVLMVFVFWELVGICSYFLIGFYIERKSASNAANKAFIVNRVGDFGMIIGLMALWGSLGTFSYAEIFEQVRPESNNFRQLVPDGMVLASAADRVAAIEREHPNDAEAARAQIDAELPQLRETTDAAGQPIYGYGLLIIAGLGIFCGCVGKSAQFPLHVWLPDAMEGPTPVSALVHSATMVAAGVYLAGRFYPVFTPETLLVIAYIGAITLFLAATIAITAVDIKRVLAYSTVSQLGYMMLALGIGSWGAAMFHLITHAFFKSLLFLCSGSVIHATHTNDMMRMGGLRKKMPWTAYTMLAGCLAIIGAGLPGVVGLSGYYSKDAIIAQAMSFMHFNSSHGSVLFAAAAGGAALTAFYMFRLWYLTFVGTPRDHHVYEHAHESPKIMYVPLVILAVFAIGVGWPISRIGVVDLLELARPAGVMVEQAFVGQWMTTLTYPAESVAHHEFHTLAGIIAFCTAMAGLLLATVMYCWNILNPHEIRLQFAGIYRVLANKWYFDELYNTIFVRPTFFVSSLISKFDRRVIDGFIDGSARTVVKVANIDDKIDRYVVDGLVNLTARWVYAIGDRLRVVQTGRLRQYVMFIVVGTVVLTVLIKWATAGSP